MRVVSCPVGETSSAASGPHPNEPATNLRGTSRRRYKVPAIMRLAASRSSLDISALTTRDANKTANSATPALNGNFITSRSLGRAFRLRTLSLHGYSWTHAFRQTKLGPGLPSLLFCQVHGPALRLLIHEAF